jgi:hypothetical protein
LGYDSDGLHLSQIVIFRLFHKPLFVPWADIKAIHRKDNYFGDAVVLEIGSNPIVTVRLKAATFLKIYDEILKNGGTTLRTT